MRRSAAGSSMKDSLSGSQRSLCPRWNAHHASWQTVSFGGRDDTFSTGGLDVTLDTRQNPAMPRNAVLASAAADVLFFGSGPTITRTRLEATGFVGVVGQHVLVVHALREDANGPLPPYLRSILGGWWTLRGYETGFMTGDTLVSGSLEYRVPIGSPRRFGKLGVSAFMDWGTAYDHGQSLSNQTIYRGAGGEHPELGHVPADPRGPQCYCGSRGCLESLASGTAIGRLAQARLRAPVVHTPISQR